MQKHTTQPAQGNTKRGLRASQRNNVRSLNSGTIMSSSAPTMPLQWSQAQRKEKKRKRIKSNAEVVKPTSRTPE
jgi:hypothetical protein